MGKHGGERCAQLNSPRCLSIRIWHCYILDNAAFSQGLPPVCREARSTAMPPSRPPQERIPLPMYPPCMHRSTHFCPSVSLSLLLTRKTSPKVTQGEVSKAESLQGRSANHRTPRACRAVQLPAMDGVWTEGTPRPGNAGK